MKKVIKGRVYDTSTAKKISECDNGVYGNDINACSETCTAQNRDATFCMDAAEQTPNMQRF